MYKVRVKRNIGTRSVETFGEVGTDFDVVRGYLEDVTGMLWGEFNTVKELNEEFCNRDCYDTIFEEMEGE